MTTTNTNTTSNKLNTLLEQYPKALKCSDKMRGWKRSLTMYCRTRSEEIDSTESKVRSTVKGRLTKLGYDSSEI